MPRAGIEPACLSAPPPQGGCLAIVLPSYEALVTDLYQQWSAAIGEEAADNAHHYRPKHLEKPKLMQPFPLVRPLRFHDLIRASTRSLVVRSRLVPVLDIVARPICQDGARDHVKEMIGPRRE